jgi:hypothetical protein
VTLLPCLSLMSTRTQVPFASCVCDLTHQGLNMIIIPLDRTARPFVDRTTPVCGQDYASAPGQAYAPVWPLLYSAKFVYQVLLCVFCLDCSWAVGQTCPWTGIYTWCLSRTGFSPVL